MGAVAVAGGALPRWWTAHWLQPMLGEQITGVTGRQAAPALLVIALVAVAGIGAVAAARGAVRRIIGLLVAVAGVLAVIAAVVGTRSLPTAVITDAHPQLERILGGERNLLGPAIAGAGGLLVLVGGGLVTAGAFAGRGIGSRFERGRRPDGVPTGRRAASADAASASVTERLPSTTPNPDDDAAALWKSLDVGDDPTADPHPGGHR
jgi:uncharacterized membrane protein (TIGR02234 family)